MLHNALRRLGNYALFHPYTTKTLNSIASLKVVQEKYAALLKIKKGMHKIFHHW